MGTGGEYARMARSGVEGAGSSWPALRGSGFAWYWVGGGRAPGVISIFMSCDLRFRARGKQRPGLNGCCIPTTTAARKDGNRVAD